MDAIYARIDDVKKPRIREALRSQRDVAELSRRLVTLQSTTIEVGLDPLRYAGGDDERLRALFTELGFTRFLRALPPTSPHTASARKPCVVVLDSDALARFIEKARRTPKLAIRVLGTSTEAMRADVYGIVFATAEGDTTYIPFDHRYLGAPKQLRIVDVAHTLGSVLSDPAIRKVVHDVEYSDVILSRHGIRLSGVVMDTMLAAYLLDPEAANTVEFLAARDGGMEVATAGSTILTKRRQALVAPDEVDIAMTVTQTAKEVEALLVLADRYPPRLRAEKLDFLLGDLELPLARILADMERTGIPRGPKRPRRSRRQMSKELARLEAQAREVTGRDFNIGSPNEFETILFDVIGLSRRRERRRVARQTPRCWKRFPTITYSRGLRSSTAR